MNARKRGRTKTVTAAATIEPGHVPTREENLQAAARTEKGLRKGAIIVAAVLAGFLVWPQISLPFSGVAEIVSDLRNDSVFVEDGVTGVDEQQIREIFGRRPVAIIVLAQDTAYDDYPLDICTKLVDRIDDIELMISQVGDGFVTQCQGDDLPTRGTELGFDAGLGFTLDRATRMFQDDVAGQAEQLALIMDSAVKGGRLGFSERTFRAPFNAWLVAGGTVIGVVGGALLLFWGVRAGSAALVARRRRRAEFGSRYEDVEATVSEAALVLLAVDPRDTRAMAATTGLADEYRAALDDLENAESTADLDALGPRADRILTDLRRVR